MLFQVNEFLTRHGELYVDVVGFFGSIHDESEAS